MIAEDCGRRPGIRYKIADSLSETSKLSRETLSPLTRS